MIDKLDPETAEVHRQAEEVYNFTESEGWQIARAKLYSRMNDVVSILGIEKTDIESIASRQIAIEIIMGWFKDIDGEVASYKNQPSQLIKRPEDDEVINYHEPKEDGT